MIIQLIKENEKFLISRKLKNFNKINYLEKNGFCIFLYIAKIFLSLLLFII